MTLDMWHLTCDAWYVTRGAKKASAEGRSPPQELEVGPRSGPYLLVFKKVPFFLVLTSSTGFRFTNFHFFHKHKKWRQPLLYQLFNKAVHISTMWTQTKWSLDLWLTNDKASYIAKEDSICLLSIVKEATLNKQWIKPGVPL